MIRGHIRVHLGCSFRLDMIACLDAAHGSRGVRRRLVTRRNRPQAAQFTRAAASNTRAAEAEHTRGGARRLLRVLCGGRGRSLRRNLESSELC